MGTSISAALLDNPTRTVHMPAGGGREQAEQRDPRTQLLVNGTGVTRPDEQPKFVGITKLTVNGKNIPFSVSASKGNWVWLRFKSEYQLPNGTMQPGMLHITDHEAMLRQGWAFSKKQRHGYWHTDVTKPQVVKLLRDLGYEGDLTWVGGAEVYRQPATPRATQTAQVHASNGGMNRTEATNNIRPLKQNKVGRWMDAETGKLASNEDVRKWLAGQAASLGGESGVVVTHRQATPPSPAQQPLVVDDEDEDELTVAYKTGFEDGYEEAQDPEVPNLRSRNDIAKWKNTTVVRLNELCDSDYLHGYLAGHESARPRAAQAQPVRGLKNLRV